MGFAEISKKLKDLYNEDKPIEEYLLIKKDRTFNCAS